MADDGLPEYHFAKALAQMQSAFLDGDAGIAEAAAQAAIRMVQNAQSDGLPSIRGYAEKYRLACIANPKIAGHKEKEEFFRMLNRVISAIPESSGKQGAELEKTIENMVFLFCEGRLPEFHQLAFGLELHGKAAINAIREVQWRQYPGLANTVSKETFYRLDKALSKLVITCLIEATHSPKAKGAIPLSQTEVILAASYMAKLVSGNDFQGADRLALAMRNFFPESIAHFSFLKRQFILQTGLETGTIDLALMDSLERYLISKDDAPFSSYLANPRNDYEIALDMLAGLYKSSNHAAAKPLEDTYLWTGQRGRGELEKAMEKPEFAAVLEDFKALGLRFKDYISDIPPSKSIFIIRGPRPIQSGAIDVQSKFINGGRIKINLN